MVICMKKKVILITIILIAIILLFPIPMRLNDGGSIEYRALLYKITDYHKLAPIESDTWYIDGIGIEIFSVEIFNSTENKPETLEVVTERIKLKDVKFINLKDKNTNELAKFNGILYGKSNLLIDYAGDLTKSIGKIDYLIGEEYLPQLNRETNCKELLNSSVLEADDKTMILNINNVAVLFNAIDEANIKILNENNEQDTSIQTHNSFVGTVLEETTTYMIVEPNEDEAERKTADRIRINYGTDHIDYLYGIGRKVIINYTGYIKETYPAQIDTNNILLEGYEEFELLVKKANNKKKTKILNNQELYKWNSDFDLYFYGLEEVNIFVDNKTMSLETALRSGKMTIDGILAKANQDVSDGVIKEARYKDGGTAEWYYEDYTIIKCHSLDGNRDVYIGVPEMRLKDID